MPLVSISNSQRKPVSRANFAATVYHGLPSDLYRPVFDPKGGYLAFLGRISPEKRPDRAIALARQLGMPLKIAAKVDNADAEYFKQVVEPLLTGAAALLFPIDWPEPFGLVMIEAMACGTPVLAFRHGSVPEIVDEGVTGCIVDTMEEAALALPKVIAMDRAGVRRRFAERFSAARMAKDYVSVYRNLLDAAAAGGMRKSALPTTLHDKEMKRGRYAGRLY
jgi:glycosyltransferase involved in cell wall biosynthesis